MSRYQLTIKNNIFMDLVELDDEEEEMLGLEWALSEIKDGYKNLKKIDGDFTLENKDEAVQILEYLQKLLGGHVETTIAEKLAELGD